MKPSDLIRYIESNGLNHEKTAPFSYVSSKGNTFHEYKIGFEKKGKGLVYHWFKIFVEIDAYGTTVYASARFDHSYSQRTGSVNRGLMHGLEVERPIRKFIEQTA